MLGITVGDTLGFMAAVLTLVAFAQTAMVPMRLAAIGANLSFIGYGIMGGHPPVLLLHLVLLPMNLQRLRLCLCPVNGPEQERSFRQAAPNLGGIREHCPELTSRSSHISHGGDPTHPPVHFGHRKGAWHGQAFRPLHPAQPNADRKRRTAPQDLDPPHAWPL